MIFDDSLIIYLFLKTCWFKVNLCIRPVTCGFVLSVYTGMVLAATFALFATEAAETDRLVSLIQGRLLFSKSYSKNSWLFVNLIVVMQQNYGTD